MIKKDLSLIYSSRDGCTIFLMTKLPKQLENYAGQYIFLNQNSLTKELFYIGLGGKSIVVPLNDKKLLEQAIQSIQESQGNNKIIYLTKQQLEELITNNGGHIPHGLRKFRYVNGLFKQLVELTPTKKIEELTTQPLVNQPPPGFQQCFIEFPLRKLSNTERDYYKTKVQLFLNYLESSQSADKLANAIRISIETYHLLKLNGKPEKPLCLILANNKKTYFQELFERGWEIIRIYGHEKSALAEIEKVPRAYLAIQPVINGKRKVLVGFMGTEIFPHQPEETWWTNDRRNQSAIWAETNFFHSKTQHIGVLNYGKLIIAAIEQELWKRISKDEIGSIHFELTGHSSGGMLATLLASHLHGFSPGSIRAFLFGTPAFLNPGQGKELANKFPNNDRYSLHTIIAHEDPAINIYGLSFRLLENNTVYIISNETKYSFLGRCAASKGTTRDNISHHSHVNYKKIVMELLSQIGETASYRPSKL